MDYLKKEFYVSLFVHILIVIVLFGLCFRIYYDSSGYDCDSCMVEFKNKAVQFDNNIVEYKLDVKVNDLYLGYIENKCLISWDKLNGYIKK